METVVLSDKQQMFNGVTYYLCGFYYQKNGKRLHRAVWEYHNGEIPKGFHVHHKDGDRSNNSIDNLELMAASAHLSEHGKDERNKERSRKNIKKAIDAARAWHGTEEGFEWHSQHVKEMWAKRTPFTYTCSFCGKEFQSMHKYGKDMNHFCHQNCKVSYRRRRLRNESKVS